MEKILKKRAALFLCLAGVVFCSNVTVFATKIKNYSHEFEVCRDTLDSLVVETVPQNQFSSDISLGIVDLKFDGENLKICELGEGPRSMFKGFDKLYRNGTVWRTLWHFCSCLNLSPRLIINGFTDEMRSEKALTEYEALGGRYARDLQKLGQDVSFIDCLKQEKPAGFFSDHNAVVVLRDNGYRTPSAMVLKKRHPKALILCEALGLFGNNKILMDSLFEDDVLKKYRPKCIVLEKNYYRELAKKVTDKLQCDCFVIKPINSAKGNGIIIVKRRDLRRTLRAIVENPSLFPDLTDPTYGYWVKDKNKTFLIEEYAPSKLIEVDGKKYDATMRVIYLLFCDKGNIGVSFLGSYWKLPAKSIKEPGLLTEKHKSSIKSDKVSSAKVAPEDYEKVTGILRSVLPLAYVKMLQNREDFYKKTIKV